MVISGINAGANMGDDTIIRALWRQLPRDFYWDPFYCRIFGREALSHYETAAQVVARLVRRFAKQAIANLGCLM